MEQKEFEKWWITTYYPIPAHSVAKEDALDHSIKKWEGIKYLCDNEKSLPIDIRDSCALCVHYFHPDGPHALSCVTCPSQW